jgi:hypothetical protein
MKVFQFRNRKDIIVQKPQSKLIKLRIWFSRIVKIGFLIWLCSNFAMIVIAGVVIGSAWYIISPLFKARKTTRGR